jgi:hypothetical protein
MIALRKTFLLTLTYVRMIFSNNKNEVALKIFSCQETNMYFESKTECQPFPVRYLRPIARCHYAICFPISDHP